MPRASTMAYKESSLQEAQPSSDQNGASALAPEVIQALPLLHQIKDTLAAVSSAGAGTAGVSLADSLSFAIAAMEGGSSPDTALKSFRSLCSECIHSLFASGNTEHATTINTVLDAINNTCKPSVAQDPQSTANGTNESSSYLLPPQQLEDVLTLQVDPVLLQRQIATADLAKTSNRGRGRARGTGGRATRAAAQVANATIAGVVGTKRKKKDQPNVWTPTLQKHIATALRLAIKREDSPGPANTNTDVLPSALGEFAKELGESGAARGIREMGTSLPSTVATLEIGGYLVSEEFLLGLKQEAVDAAETYLEMPQTMAGGLRRGKVLGVADSFCNLVGELLDTVLLDALQRAKAAQTEEENVQDGGENNTQQQQLLPRPEPVELVTLPLSIQANREPYRHGDWRKVPFVPRPYVRLKAYDIVEEGTREIIENKLKSGKRGGCDGGHCQDRDHLGTYSLEADGFVTDCACLKKNTECDDTCACATNSESCLNRAVTKRETVKLGEDVVEVNSWGMDCYTRRNIQDALLESQVFGEYTMPDYRNILRKLKKGELPKSAAATAAGQHAAVAADITPTVPSITITTGAKNLEDATDAPIAAAGPAISLAQEIRARAAETAVAKTETTDAPTSPTADPPDRPASRAELAATKRAVEQAAVEWIERTLIPAINRQGDNGWDLKAALMDVQIRAAAADDQVSLRAADSVMARLDHVGYNFFRIHPKGVGLVCKRAGGLPRLTFVEEYLGEIHTPHRWFELQDAVKKITGDELPDFYNILLERPRDDPAGYDVLFVDAAAKGAFASRMSHSCTPNCQAVPMACGGRLTIALYTLRHVQEGEELTFDYSSVTESEKEFREAICLCGTHMCRGSYLYFTGSKAFMQVLAAKHNTLHRQAILARSGMEPITDADRERIKRHGLGDSCLGSVERGDRVPEWLEKWTALICEYLDVEEQQLRYELVHNDPWKSYTEATAAAEAKGVVQNRIQNIVITLDKVKMFLSVEGQPSSPPLRPLTDEEIVNHLWRGPKSVGKKLLKGAVQQIWGTSTSARAVVTADSDEKLIQVLTDAKEKNLLPSTLDPLYEAAMTIAATPEEARNALSTFIDAMRVVDLAIGGRLTAAADIGALYCGTKRWVTMERNFKSVSSHPVPINLQDLFMNREAALISPEHLRTAETMAQGGQQALLPRVHDPTLCVPLREPSPPPPVIDPEEALKAAEAQANKMARQHARNPALRKTYRPLYLWGQLNGWFKQTVNDPTASLSAERRGTLSLPDVESCFSGSGKGRYSAKERWSILDHIQHRPEGMWKTGTQWTFRNESKVYGSPMFDDAWAQTMGEEGTSVSQVLTLLKGASVPPLFANAPRGKVRSGRPRKKSKYGYSDDEFDF